MGLYKNKPRNYEPGYKNIRPRKVNDVTFTTLHRDKSDVFVLKGTWLEKCPHFILDPGHYKADGTCLCFDAGHQKMLAADRKKRTDKLLNSQRRIKL
jgi:hypothetical protein